MFGITRIHINENTLGWRMQLALDHESVLNNIYREIFPKLEAGNEILNVDKETAMARYDYKEGVDVILTHTNGMRMTLQEKVLTFNRSTITFEETKSSGNKGAWYYCTSQLYFIGYNRLYTPQAEAKHIGLQDWIMIDYTALRIEDMKGNLNWQYGVNKRDNRRSTFRYLHFKEVPAHCVIARKKPENIADLFSSDFF